MRAMEISTLVFFVNGKKVTDPNVDPSWTLLFYIRNKLRLTGSKLGCGEGGCGACTVMVSRINRSTGTIVHESLNACLAPVVAMHGAAVTTVEGIGSTKTKLHPVQERISRAHGSQCGFCTPGIVMSMYTLLRNKPNPTMEDIEEYFTGNLCRCTGYRPILEGYRTFTGCGKTNCCQLQNGTNKDESNPSSPPCSSEELITPVLYDQNQFSVYNPSQDIIFPPELKMLKNLDTEELMFKSDRVTFYRPTTLSSLLTLKKQHPDAKIIVGNTEVGIEVKYKHQHYPVLINPTFIEELKEIRNIEGGVLVGASVTLTTLDHFCKQQINNLPDYQCGVLKAIVETLKWFAGRQIRNTAGIGGNIMTGSPISDLNPVLMAAGAELRLKSIDGERTVKMDGDFFTGYRRNIVKEEEILLSIYIPFTRQNEYFTAYKQARRRDDDIAIVNCGFRVKMREEEDGQGGVVEDLVLSFGGVAPTTVLAHNTMKSLKGMVWNEDLLQKASDSLLKDIQLPPSAPGGMVNYRRTLALSFFFKFYLTVREELSKTLAGFNQLEEDEKEIIKSYIRPPSSSTQLYQKVKNNQQPLDPLGQPLNHASSDVQSTGEAMYVDDLPHLENELFAAFVTSSKARASIASIDSTEALSLPGVHSIYSAKDLTEDQNKWGVALKDEEVFARRKVEYFGQIIAVVIAETQDLAQRAARMVKVEYEDVEKPIVTIQDALEAKSFHKTGTITKGDPAGAFTSTPHELSGEIHLGGQEHFYMETNACIVIPHEKDEITIISSTQNLTLTQSVVAETLGIPAHKVVCKVKRLGGGFGGKESRTIVVAAPLAVAAMRSGRAVRIMLDRDEDMILTGTRHPYLGRWRLAFDDQGKIDAAQIELNSNGGFSIDLSFGVLERSMFSSDSAYNIPNFSVTGRACKTNLASNTAFRGFGGPQGMMVMEDAIHRVAEYLKLPPHQVRERNLYPENGAITHHHQLLKDCTVRRCWTDVMQQSNYNQILSEVKEFNKNNRYRKRGISIVPTKYGISFTFIRLNQGSALLLVYTDGSVLITHGGTEMGQGLHTKMIQVAAHTLQIPAEVIHIAETATDKIPNASPTAASASSDIYGDAVKKACEELNERLSPLKKGNSKMSWKELISEAYAQRISLSTTGFHKTPDISPMDWETSRGDVFNYFSYGAAVSTVEIDCLTGHHSVLQTDIVMDVGNSINPALDIGQIEGAFMQGYGLMTLEELLYNPEGVLLTRGPGAYKIPGFQDIPCKFNVSLLRDAPNPKAVYSSKAVGEPPLLLAASVFFALKDAIKSAREGQGLKGPFRLDSPATAERIRMACQDSITNKLSSPEPGTFKPWAVIV